MNMITKDNKKIIKGWVWYDWANSVYPLVITSTIFPIYYNKITHPENETDYVSFMGHEFHNTVLYQI